jgi:hypothetical protein
MERYSDEISGRIVHVLKGVLFVLIVIILLPGCSVESKLNRNFKGKSFTAVMDKMGAPTTIENRIGGGTIRTYESKKMLKPAPINTGQFQYDRFDSPKVMQTIVTTFIVDPGGKVLEVKYSNDYSR